MDSQRRSAWNFHTGNQFTFGPGALKTLTSLIHRQQARRVLLIADPALEEYGTIETVKSVLKGSDCLIDTFRDPHVHPTTNHVDDAAAVAACFEPQLVVAVGGGSTLDLAKASCAAATLNCEAHELFGLGRVRQPIAPLACIPTTAGTGSEVSHRARIRDVESNRISECISHSLRPDYTIVDPELMVTCPPMVVARSGAIALFNAIEAILAVSFGEIEEPEEGLAFEGNNPLSDLLAKRATELIARNLCLCRSTVDNRTAWSELALGASLAGAALSNSGFGVATATVTALINARPQLCMGDVVLIVLPEVISALSTYVPDQTIGLAKTLDPHFDQSDPGAAVAAIQESIQAFRSDLELPATLSEVSISQRDVPVVAADARNQKTAAAMTPVNISVDALIDILQGCLGTTVQG